MPIFCQKKGHFCLNYITVLAKEVKRMLLFFPPIFHETNLCSHAHILSKNVHLLQNSWCSHTIFAICLSKTPALMPILGEKNVISINTTLHYGPKKSISRKNQCPHARLWSTNFHSLKKTLLPFPYFVKKTSNLSKT